MSPVRALLLCCVTLAGCRLGAVPEPIPFRGEAPTRILVWPAVADAFAAQQPLLLAGLDLAVRQRGYVVVTSAVGRQLLLDGGELPDPANAAAIRDATGADAVLRLVVNEFRADGDRAAAVAWDLAWELDSTISGACTWRFTHRGHWQRRAPVEPLVPSALDDDGAPVLFGDRAPDFRDALDLVPWLHRFASEHLPRAGA